MPTSTAAKPKQASAPWLRTLLSRFEAAESHVFLLHGGIDDYVTPGFPVMRYLNKAMSGPFDVVVNLSVDQGVTFAQPHMRARFFQVLGAADEAPNEPLLQAPTPMIANALTFLKKAEPQTACVIVERLDAMLGTDLPVSPELKELAMMLHRAGTDSALDTRGNPLILLAPRLESLVADVRDMGSGIRAIEIPLPNYDDRLAFARQRLQNESEVVLSGITVEQLAALTAGLYRRHIEAIILRARATAEPGKPGKLTRALSREVQKEQMDMEYGSVMRRIDNDYRLAHVGGLAEAKAYIQHRVVDALKSGKTQAVPQNVMLVGPSGTGKTLLANAAANESGINCLLVDLSQFLEGVVGGTEAKLAKWKEGVLASAPCIVVLDEIDQKMRRGAGGSDPGGGGSVENRLFGFMLEFFGDPANKGKVVGLFMSNRPKLLDDALLSRCEAIIPILPAESDEARAAILGAIMRRFGLEAQDSDSWLLTQAGRVVDWSGRDLEQVVTEALAIHQLEGLAVPEAVAEAITYRRPATQDVREQVSQALKACNNLRLMPEKYRKLIEAVKPASNGSTDEQPERRQRRTLEVDA